MNFDYNQAFCRNIGLLKEEEQEKMRNCRIAIPGLGGVGGSNLISLVRQGFERFNISDFDLFDLVNFNRQYGSNLKTIGREKIKVMKEKVLEINPNCDIKVFPNGVDGRYELDYMNRESYQGVDRFLDEVDLVVDSLDFFAVRARRVIINKALGKGIPVTSAGPIGFGCAHLTFLPGGLNFDKYFNVFSNMHESYMLMRYALGVVPKLLQRKYMNDNRLMFETFVKHIASSSVGAVEMCAGVNTINAVKILLEKGEVLAVPYYHQYDVMTNKYVCKKRAMNGIRGWVRRRIDDLIIKRMSKIVWVDELYKVHSDPELYEKYFGHLRGEETCEKSIIEADILQE